MNFRGVDWNGCGQLHFFGLKSGQDLKNRAAHLHQEFPVVPPGAYSLVHIIQKQLNMTFQFIICLTNVCKRTSNINAKSRQYDLIDNND